MMRVRSTAESIEEMYEVCNHGMVKRLPLQTLIQWCVLGLLSVSILWHGGKSLESTWFLIGIAAMCMYSLYCTYRTGSSGDISLRSNALLWGVLIVLTLWTIISYKFSVATNYGLDEVLQTGGFTLLFLWMLGQNQSDHTFDNRLLRWIVWTVILCCAIGIAVYIFQPVNRFVGTFFDHRFHTDYWPNAFADIILISWPLTFFVFPGTEQDALTNRIKKALPLGFLFGCLLLSYSRGAMIALTGQLALYTLMAFAQHDRKMFMRHAEKMAYAIAIACAVFALINILRAPFYDVQPIQEKATFTSDEGRGSIDERASFFKQSIALTLDKPIFGWGPYSFRFVQPRLQTAALATSDHPHNVFLKYAMERGIPAALMFLFVVIIILLQGIRHAVYRANTKALLIVTGIAGLLAHSMIDYNLQFVGISLVLWLLLGMLARMAPLHQPMRVRTTSLQLVLALAIGTFLIIIACREGAYLVTSSLGRHAEVRGETDQAIAWYEASQYQWFKRDMELSYANLLTSQNKTSDALLHINRYLAHNTEDARAYVQLSELYKDLGQDAAAIEHYIRAFELGGWNDLRIIRGLLETLLAQSYEEDDTDSYKNTIQEMLPNIEQVLHDFAAAILENRHFTALSPNPEEAQRICIILAVLVPERAEWYRQLGKDVIEHATMERERISARAPGYLW